MTDAPFRPKPPTLSLLLWPLGVAFLGLARVRAGFYKCCHRPIRLGRPTIAVGNLTFGGTGKTPLTVAIARLLQEEGQRPAVLLRGYGRTTHGARRVYPTDLPGQVGEEAVLLARSLPGVPIAVGEHREEAAALVRQECSVFLLDDAFQHLRVHRDVDLLLVDASRPFDLHAPPAGRLREPLSAARRASALIVTRGSTQDLPPYLVPAAEGRPLVAARFGWDPVPQGGSDFSSWNQLAGAPLVAFAGIGNPWAFFAQAQALGLSLSRALAFPDHAPPTQGRLSRILDAAEGAGAKAVLTTEKDAVKWAPAWPGRPPLIYPRLTVSLEGDVAALRGLLLAACAGPAEPAPTS